MSDCFPGMFNDYTGVSVRGPMLAYAAADTIQTPRADIGVEWAMPTTFASLADLVSAFPEMEHTPANLVGDLNENPLNVTYVDLPA